MATTTARTPALHGAAAASHGKAEAGKGQARSGRSKPSGTTGTPPNANSKADSGKKPR
jgi:hypothetical protein